MNKMTERDEKLRGILQAASKHPNSRIAKLIHSIEEDHSQKNIILLLMELAEHADFANDFGISLKYYLDLFERLGRGRDLVLNEAGLLLLNSSKIYSRRVDYIYDLVKQQLMMLSNAEQKSNDKAAEKESVDAEPVTKVKRGRKRVLEASTDPYEVELAPKKFRKLTADKRMSNTQATTVKKTSPKHDADTEQYLHPAVWMHATIVDLENEEEVDSKRNYKLFTYHVEHRYNTLVPDINFRLHFKMKDYMDEEEERMETEYNDLNAQYIQTWPPLSEAYVEKYLHLENHILKQEMLPKSKRYKFSDYHNEASTGDMPSALNVNSTVDTAVVQNSSNSLENSIVNNTQSFSESMAQDSALGRSILNANSTNANTSSSRINENSLTTDESANDTTAFENALEQNLLSSLNRSNGACETTTVSNMNDSQEDSALGDEITATQMCLYTDESRRWHTQNAANCTSQRTVGDILEKQTFKEGDTEVELNNVRVYMPHLNIEGEAFTNLKEDVYRLLTPKVLVSPDKRVKSGDTFVTLSEYSIAWLAELNKEPETYKLPTEESEPVKAPAIVHNILKIPEKHLRRRVLFKLGPDMELYIKARTNKRSRVNDMLEYRQPKMLKWFSLYSAESSDVVQIHSPNYEAQPEFFGFNDSEDDGDTTEFYGFNEDELLDLQISDLEKTHRLSRDSGVYVDMNTMSKSNLNAINEESNDRHIVDNNNTASTPTTTTHSTEEVTSELSTQEKQEQHTTKTTTDQESNKKSTNENSVNISPLYEFQPEQQTELELNITKTKIQKWHAHLQPILTKARERHHFDVFKLGTEIIEEIRRPKQNEIEPSSSFALKTFQNVMDNKDESYVSRYFLSTLLLANQGNIHIELPHRSSEEPTAWSDIHLKLLSAKRHTVAIEDNIGMLNSNNNVNAQQQQISTKVKSTKNRKILESSQATTTATTTTTTPASTKAITTNCSRQQLNSEKLHVNLSVVTPLKEIEKMPRNGDDYDSGIFSSEELLS